MSDDCDDIFVSAPHPQMIRMKAIMMFDISLVIFYSEFWILTTVFCFFTMLVIVKIKT